MSSIDYWMKQAEKWKIRANTAIKAGDKRITELEVKLADAKGDFEAMERTANSLSNDLTGAMEQIAELEEKLRWAVEVVKATKSMAETCLEERKMGNGGCGACSICCGEHRERAETAEAENVKLQRKLNFLHGEDGCEHERRYWEDGTDDEGDPFDNCVACERDELKAENVKLREALHSEKRRRHGRHASDCAIRETGQADCDCGWQEIDAALAKGDKKC